MCYIRRMKGRLFLKKKEYLISSSEISDIVYRNGKGLGYYIEPYLVRRAMKAIRRCCENCYLDKPSVDDFVSYVKGEKIDGTPSGDQVREFAQMVFWNMYQKELSSHAINVCCTVYKVDSRFVNYISRIYLYMQKLIPCY